MVQGYNSQTKVAIRPVDPSRRQEKKCSGSETVQCVPPLIEVTPQAVKR
ncbi:hypothetical protein EM595_2766 [Duffyella gerundensis]|uniref:Uncharacterized protein n=1 Tax=Duffyella gerundensis TaxID=1619313 RepID=A0A0U5L7F4_9GAMM|nr:hypothetical protein EM595_2766 [Duffyella gerundensis]